MREYTIRVRRAGDVYTATLREIAPCGHPDALPVVGVPSIGTAASPSAAIVSAVAAAHVADFTEPRRSPYAV
jgi:hypothetical protein